MIQAKDAVILYLICTLHLFFFLLMPTTFISLQATPVNIIVGSHVWVEDPALAWVDGEVIRISGQEVHVQTTTGKTVSFTTFINDIS